MSTPRFLTTALAIVLALGCGTASGGTPGDTPMAEAAPRSGSPTGETTASTTGPAPATGEQAAAPAGEQEGPPPGVAVLPFVNGGSYGDDAEDLDALRVGLQQMLLTELDQNEELRVVERSELKRIMEEQDLGATDRVDASTAARIGQLVGARYMVTGVFMDLSGDFRMDARIIDVETSEIVHTETVRGERDELYGLLVDLATKITEGADLPPLPAVVREERREREIPAEAITLYSRAQVYQDRGYEERAIEVYRRIVEEFPAMQEARSALEQLGG